MIKIGHHPSIPPKKINSKHPDISKSLFVIGHRKEKKIFIFFLYVIQRTM